MSEGRVPAPQFDPRSYERPHKAWICGNAADGCPCRIGPSPWGRCRATTECKPVLELHPNEKKGTWKCTRPNAWGGPCPSGPLPDGTCSRAIPKCQPVRSVRGRRGLVTRSAVAAAAGVILVGFSGSMREAFTNPAPLSRQHSGPEFVRLALAKGGGQGCVLCHVEARARLLQVGASAIRAAAVSLRLDGLTSSHAKDFSQMDRSCAGCHEGKSFHQANAPRDVSCSVCHREHRGEKGLIAVYGDHCTSCHGSAEKMGTAARQGRELCASALPRKTAPGVVAHADVRPPEGYTAVIHGFGVDHPQFRAALPNSTDPNTLKFNHHTHLTDQDIPPVDGQRLDCGYCHKPDASGAFMQRITFEKNCRVCHSLNFDENNPGLTLPHGDPGLVRAFLVSLPTNYADFATRYLGLVRKEDVQAFVERQMRAIRARTESGQSLEREVFFADASTGDAPAVAGLNGPARAKFAGCALCHEVLPRADTVPEVTPPHTPDRWMTHARFNHSRHVMMKCTECHAATESIRAMDVIMASQETCLRCHGPTGNVRYDCSICHVYHNEPVASPPAASCTAHLSDESARP